MSIYLRISAVCFVIIAVGLFLRRDKGYKAFSLSSLFLSSFVYGFLPLIHFVFAFKGLKLIAYTIKEKVGATDEM